MQAHPVLLMILDGFGFSEEKEGNAIAAAVKPCFDRLWHNYPHALLSASGLDVGLPAGQMGNSEVGHLHIGAGQRVFQDLTKIDLEVENGSFFKNEILLGALRAVKNSGKNLHIFGLLSAGGIHSRNTHIEALIDFAAREGVDNVYLHAFLDGRDTPPKSALSPIKSMLQKMQEVHCGEFASICGRFYAMDRDKRWDRVAAAYDLYTNGVSEYHFADVEAALTAAYARGETDEFVKPTAIHGENSTPKTLQDGDVVIFMNFRADRARELSYALTKADFTGFERQVTPKLAHYVTLTEYAADLEVEVAYPKAYVKNGLGETVSQAKMKQLRIAETEKYAHVTYFINGGREEPFPGEDRLLVPSPKVATYDLQPEMSVNEVSDRLAAAIRSQQYQFFICNFANPDMVGHTGNFAAAVKAIETVDVALAKVMNALSEVDGEAVIIADHGNAEKMIDLETHEPHTAHTTNLVPFICCSSRVRLVKGEGKLTDVAPTILKLLGLNQPSEMTGQSMIELC